MITKNSVSHTLIIRPIGDLNALQSEHYRQQLRSLVEEGYRFLIFDLEETAYINSCGLGLLVEFFNVVRRLEGSLRLINCNAQVSALLEQTQLDRILLRDPAAQQQVPAPEAQFDPLHALMSSEIAALTRVHAVTEKILVLDDPKPIAEAILSGVIETLKAARGAFFMLSEDQRRLRLTCWRGRDQEDPRPRLREVTLQKGSLEFEILGQDDVLWHEADGQNGTDGGLIRKLGFQTLLAAPIYGRQRRYGLLAIEPGEETGRITQAVKPLVRTLTNLCGLALEKATLLTHLRSRNEELHEMIERAHDYHQSLVDAGKLAALGVVISGLSHLINNKMAPLIGYSQMLSQKEDLPEWVSDKVRKIHQSSNEMNLVVAKLVKASHLRERAVKPIDHLELLHTAVNLLSGLIEERGIAVHLRTTQDPAEFSGDPDLLLQAIIVALHRSCTSFTPEQPDERWLRIITSVAGQNLRIVIEDNGLGFDEYDKDDWLDPLVPSEAMENGRLFNYAIPRNIIRRHNGALTLEPCAPAGKRVIIDLPIAAPHSETPADNGCRVKSTTAAD